MSAWKQGYNSDGVELRGFYVEHDPVDLHCPPEEGMTRQEFANETDINWIMARYTTTGVMDRFNLREPLYLDVSEVPTDLQGVLAFLDRAEEAFMRLPALVRKEFDNSAVRFVEFAENPANVDRMREWGLARPVEPAAAVSGSQGSGEPARSAASTGEPPKPA